MLLKELNIQAPQTTDTQATQIQKVIFPIQFHNKKRGDGPFIPSE